MTGVDDSTFALNQHGRPEKLGRFHTAGTQDRQ